MDRSAATQRELRPLSDYPLTWTHIQRGGYGFTLRTPCRIVGETPKKLRIAIPTNSGERIKLVPREKVTG